MRIVSLCSYQSLIETPYIMQVDDLILVIQKNKIQLEFLTAAFGPPK
jgi:hypothetical protein